MVGASVCINRGLLCTALRRCPMLCALGLTMTDSDFLFPVVKSHLNQQGCTLQHLQLCLALDLYVLVEHRVVRNYIVYVYMCI